MKNQCIYKARANADTFLYLRESFGDKHRCHQSGEKIKTNRVPVDRSMPHEKEFPKWNDGRERILVSYCYTQKEQKLSDIRVWNSKVGIILN